MIQAIQTKYKDYNFRSRLEAKWAVFFDALGLKWEYEPEGFTLPGGIRYLPDFRITSPTGLVQWYEVKPVGVTSDNKVTLANARSYDADGGEDCGLGVQILSGDPLDHIAMGVPEGHGDPTGTVRVCPRCGRIGVPAYGFSTWGEGQFGCEPCDFNTPSGGENVAEMGLFAAVTPHKGTLLMEQPDVIVWLLYVRRAANISRAARFEHGETPVVEVMNAIHTDHFCRGIGLHRRNPKTKNTTLDGATL